MVGALLTTGLVSATNQHQGFLLLRRAPTPHMPRRHAGVEQMTGVDRTIPVQRACRVQSGPPSYVQVLYNEVSLGTP